MLRHPQLRAAAMGAVVEDAVRAVVVPARPVGGLPEVVRPSGLDLLPGLLGAVSGAGEIAIKQRGDDPVREDSGRRAGADPVLLPARVIGGEDDASRGHLRLVKAINGFDPLLGRDFLAYARPMMTGEVKRHFRDLTWAVRVPRKIQEGRIELSQATSALSQRLGRQPAMHELAAELGISMNELAELMAASAAYSALSLNMPGGPDESGSLADTLGAVDEALDAVLDRESLHALLDALPPRVLRLLLLRFFGNLTQAQIAAELGISQMQVSRLLSAALAGLRASMLTEET